jgi:hypothetical protein
MSRKLQRAIARAAMVRVGIQGKNKRNRKDGKSLFSLIWRDTYEEELEHSHKWCNKNRQRFVHPRTFRTVGSKLPRWLRRRRKSHIEVNSGKKTD